jgi:hypothetical protein
MRQRSKTIGEAKDDSLLVSEERIVKRLHGEDGSGSPNSKRVTLSISPLAATEASAFDANSLVVAGGRSNGQFSALSSFCLSIRSRHIDEASKSSAATLREYVERQIHQYLPTAGLAVRGLTLATGLADQFG